MECITYFICTPVMELLWDFQRGIRQNSEKTSIQVKVMKSLKPVNVGPKAGKYSYVMFHNKAECRTNKIQPEIFSCPIGD